MEVALFWTKNLKTDTEDHHMVGEAYIIEA